MASNLAARVVARSSTSADDVAKLVTTLEGAMLAIEGAARLVDTSKEWDDEMLRQAWSARFAAQDAVQHSNVLATELIGGLSFINDFDVRYLSSALSCLAFHPANRRLAATSIATLLREGGAPPQDAPHVPRS
jgi:alkylation response protein AidB-like acyl-CoA dehydrogenase